MMTKLAEKVVEFFREKCAKKSWQENAVISFASAAIILFSISLMVDLFVSANEKFGLTAGFGLLLFWVFCSLLLTALCKAASETLNVQVKKISEELKKE